jgi:hypothetical protein
MTTANTNRFIVAPTNLFLYLAYASALTLFLFYIDEGYYSFAWMSEPGAWFVFSLYNLFFLIVLLLIDAFTFRKIFGIQKGLVSLAIGFLINFILVITLFIS